MVIVYLINLIIAILILPITLLYFFSFIITFGFFNTKLIKLTKTNKLEFALTHHNNNFSRKIFLYSFFKKLKFKYAIGIYFSLFGVYEFVTLDNKNSRFVFSIFSNLSTLFIHPFETFQSKNRTALRLKIIFFSLKNYLKILINGKKLVKLILSNNTNIISQLNDKNNIIFIDFEFLGKKKRQSSMNSFISEHRLSDLDEIRKKFPKSKLLIRLNPYNKNSKVEINSILKYKPNFIMLPNYKSIDEIKSFFNLIPKNVKLILLCENKLAIESIPHLIDLPFKPEFVFFGLNDLKLSYGFNFIFETLSNGIIESALRNLQEINIFNFGFGGISVLGNGLIDSRRILIEHQRVKSKYVILSRSFFLYSDEYFENLEKMEEFEESICLLNREDFDLNKKLLNEEIISISKK